MTRPTTLATFCLGLAAAGWVLAAAEPPATEPAPVVDCPFCGSWELVGSEPDGAAGERIVIGPQSVTLPPCGEFRIDEIDALTWREDAGRRAYRAMLRLRPATPDRGCGSADEGGVWLEVSVVDGHPGQRAGGAAFSVFADGSDAPRLSAIGEATDERHAGAPP